MNCHCELKIPPKAGESVWPTKQSPTKLLNGREIDSSRFHLDSQWQSTIESKNDFGICQVFKIWSLKKCQTPARLRRVLRGRVMNNNNLIPRRRGSQPRKNGFFRALKMKYLCPLMGYGHFFRDFVLCQDLSPDTFKSVSHQDSAEGGRVKLLTQPFNTRFYLEKCKESA